jgi:DNA-binding MarR family transcriptional regulator
MSDGDIPITGLVQELVRHTRLVHLIKQRAVAAGQHSLDMGALGMLHQLVECGARRQGDLAERAQLDPSTVSRYVSQLVKAELVARRPDPDDGRAVQLVPTDAGRAQIARARQWREAMIADVVARWTADDLTTLTRLLNRLNDDFDTFHRTETP